MRKLHELKASGRTINSVMKSSQDARNPFVAQLHGGSGHFVEGESSQLVANMLACGMCSAVGCNLSAEQPFGWCPIRQILEQASNSG